jgi:hypothetical protein
MNDIALFFAGLLLGCLLTLSLAFPTIGRTVARILAVLLLGLGLGFLVWASVAAYRGERTRLDLGSINISSQVSDAFGFGAGFTFCGVMALILALRSWRRTDKEQVVQAGPVVAPEPTRR